MRTSYRTLLRLTGLCCAGLLLLTACGLNNDDAPEMTPTSEPPTPTPLPLSQVTPQPESEVVPDVGEGRTLIIWWPDQLPVDAVLEEQIQEFVAAENGTVNIDFRLKRVTDVGGIMYTLRSGLDVAPDAMPDLTLMRREDLAQAVRDELIQPMEGSTSVSATIIGGLYDVALTLGQVDDRFYGLPYLLTMLHYVYLPGDSLSRSADWTFDAVLARDIPFVFPAQRQTGVSETFLLQYLVAGGDLPQPGEVMVLNPDALLTVLTFYEQALAAEIVTEAIFDYSSTLDYQNDLGDGTLPAAVVRANLYLQLREDESAWQMAPVPTVDGEDVSLVDGWMWVMVAQSEDQQAVAVDFLNWMMALERQRRYAEAVNRLPSQEIALRNMSRTMIDTDTADSLLRGGIPAITQSSSGVLLRAMQNALLAVVSGDATAEEATQDVISLVGAPE